MKIQTQNIQTAHNLNEDTYLPQLVDIRYTGIIESFSALDLFEIRHVLRKRWASENLGVALLNAFCGVKNLRREGMDISIIVKVKEVEDDEDEGGNDEDNNGDNEDGDNEDGVMKIKMETKDIRETLI
ncbi:hypothetical protein BDQ17DRAFT_1430134 [Cyathus striatus]|nr:hypothetical protein BDQ17DRAFT_1430134 [Cyathus striatus]